MPSPNLVRDNDHNVIQESYNEKEFRAEYTGANMIYAAFAIPGTAEGTRAWQIKKLAYDGANLISVKWPEISSGKPTTDFSFSWTARAGYTYS